jgi:hypothetical protein
MARLERLVIPGMPHHIVQRGNHRMNVFQNDADRFVFLRMLKNWSEWLGTGENKSAFKFISNCTKSGRPCGSESSIKKLEQIACRILIPRKVGRPSKKDSIEEKMGPGSKSAQKSLSTDKESLKS